MPTSGVAVTSGMSERPPATGRGEVGDRQEQDHRVVVPQDRRQELAGDDRDEVRRLRGGEPGGRDDGPEDDDRRGQLDERGELGRDAELVGDRARREVVRRRDRVADLPDEGHEVGPCADPGQHGREHRQHAEDDRPDDRRPPAPGQHGPDEQDPRLELDRRAQRGARPQPDRVVQPAPADREQEVQDRADLAELDRVGDGPRQAGQQDDPPADRPRHGQDGRPDRERGDQQPSPDPDRRRLGQEAEGEHDGRERRRVVEQPEAAGRLEAHVVQRLAVEQPDRGLVVGQEVEAERPGLLGRPDDQPDERREHEQGDDRQRRPAEPAPGRSVGHDADVAPRPLRRWMSGIRNRSQATRSASPGLARIREPRRSYQRIGTIASR